MKPRVSSIDAAKAAAIFGVIVVHVSQVLTIPQWAHLAVSFGAMGVQLFFIMSAYCLCMTWKESPFCTYAGMDPKTTVPESDGLVSSSSFLQPAIRAAAARRTKMYLLNFIRTCKVTISKPISTWRPHNRLRRDDG